MILKAHHTIITSEPTLQKHLEIKQNPSLSKFSST